MYKNLDPLFVEPVLCGGPVTCLSTVSKLGVSNLMAVRHNTPYGGDVIASVLDPTHTSSQNIKETQRFVLTIPPLEQARSVIASGLVHGRDVGDKYEYLKLQTQLSEKLQVKVLTQQLAYLECIQVGTSVFKKTGILLGKVVNLYVQQDAWDDENRCFINGIKRSFHYIKDDLVISAGELIRLSADQEEA